MSDILDMLVGNGAPDTQDVVNRLRNQQKMGTIAALSGIAPLQKLGNYDVSNADVEANDIYKQQQTAKDRQLQRDLSAEEARQRSLDRASTISAENQRASEGRALTRALAEDRTSAAKDAAQEKLDAKNKANADRAATSYDSATSGLDELAETATALRNHPGLGGITGLQSHVPNLPGGDAANAHALMGHMLSDVQIQAMLGLKNASKTGSTGFGQLSEREGEILRQSMAALDQNQSTDAFKAQLDKIIKTIGESKARLRAAAEREQMPAAASALPSDVVTDSKGVKWKYSGSGDRSKQSNYTQVQ